MSPPKHPLPATGPAKPPPDKSKFLQTCNRLSLFLKEKGNIRDLNAKFDATGVSAAKATTVDLLSSIDEPASNSLPQYVISCQVEDSANKATKPKSAQMTIFYEGQVLVLDDVPADRARDLMLMAKNGRPNENRVDKSPADGSIRAEADLPIARRASLHKFLAKRKDRATVRQPYPYHLHNQSPGGSSSGNEQHSFDLNM